MRYSLATIVLVTLIVAVRIEAQERSAIEQVLADFSTAFNARDAAKLTSLYADDAVLMPQGVPMIKGRAAVQLALSGMVARGGVVRFDPPSEVEVIGDRAVAAGTYSFTISGQGGGAGAPQVIAAKYLTVFKRVGRDWKIAYDMQNVDVAPK